MRYVFGDYTLDTRQSELCHAGEPVKLRLKVFQVLVYLLTHRDRPVPKQELCEHLWPQQFVSDATLDSCIAEVRQAVGDSGRGQHIIQTRRGYGYRFVAAVEVHSQLPSEDDGSPTPPTLHAAANASHSTRRCRGSAGAHQHVHGSCAGSRDVERITSAAGCSRI
jgi:DNA-binding winged helix-turn-helix (wHTH) protein